MACIQQILNTGTFDEVLLVPCGARPDKPNLSPSVDRLAMCHLSVERFPRQVKVSGVEVEAPPQFATYDLLKKLERQQPGKEYVFVIGSDWLDSSTDIAGWESSEGRTGEKLLNEYDFLVVPRVGSLTDGDLSRWGPRFHWVAGAAVDVSSTEIRNALANGREDDIKHLVPEKVLRYIKSKDLYSASDA